MKPGRALRGWLCFEAFMKLCCCLALLGVTQGQFFSKTTNTIPRMGRRDLDYAQLEEPRMGLFRAIPARQSASMVDLGYLDGVTQDRAREKQVATEAGAELLCCTPCKPWTMSNDDEAIACVMTTRDCRSK